MAFSHVTFCYANLKALRLDDSAKVSLNVRVERACRNPGACKAYPNRSMCLICSVAYTPAKPVFRVLGRG
ncbi:hypothetical protein FIU97_02465 [Roseivivax sp. THAF40]|nr:hypothetical protein FIU97_02465 [Roseivivax sp. THAF40]